MRKIKEISLALVIIPFLTSGCVQEKISKITPKKSINNEMTLNSDEENSIVEENEIEEDFPAIQTVLNDEIYAQEDITPPKEDILYKLATIIQEDTRRHHALTPTIQKNTNSQIVKDVTKDVVVKNIVKNTISTKIKISNNKISNNWTQLSKEDEIVETAKKFLGTKYVWAANGPNCFDCSGFTKYVYKQNGIPLPRYSGHQAKAGTKVSFDELQKGDLVFFDTKHKFRGRVNHVGIYIGNHKFIHASSAKKKVVITSFDKKPFYRKRFLRGERFINSVGAYASL